MFTNRLRGLLNLHIGITVLMAAFLLMAYQNIFRYLYSAPLNPTVNILPILFCVLVAMVVSNHYIQSMAYRFHRLSWVDSARVSTRQTVIVALFIFALLFAMKDREMSRMFISTYLVLMWSMLLFLNAGLPRLLCRLFFDRSRRIPTLFFGTEKNLGMLRQWLASKEMLGLHPVGFISEQEHTVGGSMPPFLGGIAEMSRVITARKVVQVIVLELPRSEANAKQVIDTCQRHGCRLLIYANIAEQLQHPLVTVAEEGYQFYTLQEEPLEDPLNRLLKRAFDIVVALPVVVLMLPPLMGWVWCMQRLQARGSLFFTQERTGHGQKRFRIFKFRTMFVRKQTADDEALQAQKCDSRVYPFGRFLRTSSLDEFPQFLNVLIGDMSVVGPRPHLVAHDQRFADLLMGYRTRFFVKPGITGMAQCYGLRGEITDPKLLEKRVSFDVHYIAHWSIWLDVQLVFRTAWQVVYPKDVAY